MVGNIFAWQPRSLKEVIEDTPHVPLVMIMDVVMANMKKTNSDIGGKVDYNSMEQFVPSDAQYMIGSLAGSVIKPNPSEEEW